jgi:hypothetical protein
MSFEIPHTKSLRARIALTLLTTAIEWLIKEVGPEVKEYIIEKIEEITGKLEEEANG